jgi:bacterioferritin-associated ferredoxin
MPDEDQLICYCFQVYQSEIVSAIQKYHLQTVDQVTKTVRAGGGCRTCRFDIEPLLQKYADPSQPPPLHEELNEIQLFLRASRLLENLQKESKTYGVLPFLDRIEGATLFLQTPLLPSHSTLDSSFWIWIESQFRQKLHPKIQVKPCPPPSSSPSAPSFY